MELDIHPAPFFLGHLLRIIKTTHAKLRTTVGTTGQKKSITNQAPAPASHLLPFILTAGTVFMSEWSIVPFQQRLLLRGKQATQFIKCLIVRG
jgi:hypothetical protein